MKIKKFRSLSFKLTVWYIIILGIIIILAGAFFFQRARDSMMRDLDQVLLEIADDTNEKWQNSRGVTWEDAIARAEETFSSYNPYLQLVEITEKGEREIAGIIRSNKIPEGAFKLDIRLYCKADTSELDNLVFTTEEDDRLSAYPLRIFLLPVRGPRILQVGIPLEKTSAALNQLRLLSEAA
jgi:hypothetical protein